MTREQWREEGFAFGEVKKESVYILPNGKTKIRIPPPPPQHNRGNEVISVSALARYQQRQAEAAGAYVLTETSATQLIVEDGQVVGVRSGDKGRGKDGEPLSNFEPGTDIKARATVLAEGCWGHITGAAIKEFDLAAGREPQVWEFGVKEVWKVRKPLDRVIHTLAGWPLKISAKYGQIGGSWIYPMKDEKSGDDLVSIGFIVDLDYADATTSAHDLLQQIKTHPLFKDILEGGERVAWGAKALPAGGYWAMPKLSMPGALLVGDAAGIMNLASLKGVHYAIKSGMLAAESIYAALKRGESAFESYEQVVEESFIGKDLCEQRNTRQPFQKGLIKGGPLVNLMIATKGRFPGGRWSLHRNDATPDVHRQDQRRLSEARRQIHLRQALLGVHHRQRDPRRCAQPHPRAKRGPARDRRNLALDVPGGGVRDPRGRARRGRGGRDRQLHQLRAVRRDHRQGWTSDHPRGRRRSALSDRLKFGFARADRATQRNMRHEAVLQRCRASHLHCANHPRQAPAGGPPRSGAAVGGTDERRVCQKGPGRRSASRPERVRVARAVRRPPRSRPNALRRSRAK